MGGRGQRPEQEWVYGMHPVGETLEVDPEGATLLRISGRRQRGAEALLERASALGVAVEHVEPRVLDAMCEGGNHQGVALRVKPYKYAELGAWIGSLGADQAAVVVVLDEVQDPANLGAVLRTAAAVGVGAVVIPDRRAASVTPAVVRASAGVARRVRVCQVGNLSRELGRLKEAGFWVTGAVARGGVSPWEVDLCGRVVLVMGSEGRGVRRLVEEGCDHRVTIPLVGGVESLNVSAAAAMMMYEVVRQRGGAPGIGRGALEGA